MRLSTSNIGNFRKLQDEVNEAKRYGMTFKFDRFEVCTEPDEFAEYDYEESDASMVYDWYAQAVEELKNEVTAIGLQFENTGDSIYIHNGNGKCISLRDHKVAESTRKHWNEIFPYNFGETIDTTILN